MKKTVLALAVMAFSAVSYQAQARIKIFGFEISFEKGTKEWNGDKTAAECIGKGLCKITLGASALTYNGNLGTDEDGHLIFIPGVEFNQRFPNDLSGGNLPVSELSFRAGELSSLGINGPLKIPAGTYPTKYDANYKTWYVVLN